MGCMMSSMSPDIATHVALRGYDPMSYRDGKTPTPGDPAFTSTYEAATYYFISEANKAKFDSDPEQYAPAYGGWCAFAMSEGKLFDIDPMRYKFGSDGRLYMFYNGAGGDTLPKWDADEAARLAKADKIWKDHAYAE